MAPVSMAKGKGKPALAVKIVMYAPHITNSPCARLITPIMPKITARPKADRVR